MEAYRRFFLLPVEVMRSQTAPVCSCNFKTQQKVLTNLIHLRNSMMQQKLIVLDFDRTIMRDHLFQTHMYEHLNKILITDTSFVDLCAFREFVQNARKLGHIVAVATFGRKDIVDKAMRFAFGENHGLVISSPRQFGMPDGSCLGDKNRQLIALAKMFHIHYFGQIILLDDDEHNVRAARERGANAWHTPKGLTPSLLSDVATVHLCHAPLCHALGQRAKTC